MHKFNMSYVLYSWIDVLNLNQLFNWRAEIWEPFKMKLIWGLQSWILIPICLPKGKTKQPIVELSESTLHRPQFLILVCIVNSRYKEKNVNATMKNNTNLGERAHFWTQNACHVWSNNHRVLNQGQPGKTTEPSTTSIPPMAKWTKKWKH